MIVTFLIGNGFDVSCGLKSSYSDCYVEYKKTTATSELLKHFKKDINSDYKTWADFEMGMAIYARSLSSEGEFISCVEDFSNFLGEYLRNEQKQFKKGYGELPKNGIMAMREQMLQSIGLFYKGLIPNEERKIEESLLSDSTTINFISFNYTDIFDYLLNDALVIKDKSCLKEAQLSEVIHIHGSLDRVMVMGVDNESQLEGLPYELSFMGKCSFIKPFLNSLYDDYKVQQTEKNIKESDILCVFGMSLGASDKKWKDTIGEWLISNPNHHLIFYDYSAMFQETLLPRQIIWITTKTKRWVAERLNIEYERIKEQIHIPINTMYFNLKRVEYIVPTRVLNPPHSF